MLPAVVFVSHAYPPTDAPHTPSPYHYGNMSPLITPTKKPYSKPCGHNSPRTNSHFRKLYFASSPLSHAVSLALSLPPHTYKTTAGNQTTAGFTTVEVLGCPQAVPAPLPFISQVEVVKAENVREGPETS